MSKDVGDNLVSVEFNQSYKLLFIICQLDQKNFFSGVRNIPWLGKHNWEEQNQTDVLALKKKNMKERKRKTLCLCYVQVFLIAVDPIIIEWR